MSSGVTPRVLVVEDESAIRELLCAILTTAGFEVEFAANAEDALEYLQESLPNIILIDWMLPGVSGFHLARWLRAETRTHDLPCILLTARGAEADRVAGLEVGADDYITKPFSPRELVARIRAVLRRRAPQYAGDILTLGGVRLDPAAVQVSIGDQRCLLGPTEFKLLRVLMAHPGRVFSRTQLLDLAWGENCYVEERTVDVSIRRLRGALTDAGGAGDALIETVRGVGYRFSVAASQERRTTPAFSGGLQL
ncbi:DNA-binding transcriptional dual regulator PhoB [Gammaproteobacteria bacterium]